MAEPVKTRRYDNSRREAQVRAAKADVVQAARQLFVDRGDAATTIEGIAEASQMPPATVYRLFGSDDRDRLSRPAGPGWPLVTHASRRSSETVGGAHPRVAGSHRRGPTA